MPLIFFLTLLAVIAAMGLGWEAARQDLCRQIAQGIRDAMASGQTYTMEPEVYNFYATCEPEPGEEEFPTLE